MLYIVWGSVYLAVREAVHFWPPFLLVGVRFILAGVVMLLWARWRGKAWPRNRRQWLSVSVVGALMVAGANGGVTWGVQHVDSGLAAVLIATVPAWLILFESLRPSGDRPRFSTIAGLGVGLFGVAMLVQPNLGVASQALTLTGQLALLGAAMMWALGSICTRHFEMPRSFAMSAALQMLIGGAMLTLIGVLQGEVQRVPNHLKFWPVVAFLYMTFVSSVFGYSVYQWLIQSARPALVATYAYVNPVVAIVLGIFIAHEPFTLTVLSGSSLVVFSAFLIQRVRS